MSDTNLEVRDTISALLLFADIVESSKYSAVLGYTKYAKRLLKFQRLFERLGREYFPTPEDPTQELCQVCARGDEGTIFLTTLNGEFGEHLFRAIEFLYHLKGLLRFGMVDDEGEGVAPTRIGLGAGIHVGKVAFAISNENNRLVIKQLEGFSINYAKRVESCSRLGKYSRVFLSREAAKLLEERPVVLSSVRAPMKGIQQDAEIYEVQSGLFGGLKINSVEEEENEELVEEVLRLSGRPSEIEEPWEKALVVSVLDCLLEESPVGARKAEYREKQLRLAWYSPVEDDPILLYVRAREFEEKGEYSQQLRYLRTIVEKHPDFVHARKRLIRACWAMASKTEERREVVLARDLAKEFLDKFPGFLSNEEKKECEEILRVTAIRRKQRK